MPPSQHLAGHCWQHTAMCLLLVLVQRGNSDVPHRTISLIPNCASAVICLSLSLPRRRNTIVLEKMILSAEATPHPHSSPSSDRHRITLCHCRSFFRPLANSPRLVKMLQAKVPFWSSETSSKWFEFIHWTVLILGHARLSPSSLFLSLFSVHVSLTFKFSLKRQPCLLSEGRPVKGKKKLLLGKWERRKQRPATPRVRPLLLLFITRSLQSLGTFFDYIGPVF